MSIPLSSTITMFSFTKVESWRNINFLPKCIRLHQIASQISKFSRGWHPRTPIPDPSPARRFAPRLNSWPSATRWYPLRVSYSPPWNKRLDKALRPTEPICSHFQSILSLSIRTVLWSSNKCSAINLSSANSDNKLFTSFSVPPCSRAPRSRHTRGHDSVFNQYLSAPFLEWLCLVMWRLKKLHKRSIVYS